MSSHHIVRDFQEPALLVADGEMCSISLLEQLLEWSPVVVALDEAFPKLMDLGIKVDYWLGDFDTINPEEYLKTQGQDHVEIVHRPNQDKTDLDKGIEFLISKNAHSIHIVWATGKRLDHELANYSSVACYADQVNLVLWNDWSKAYMVPKRFSKWFAAESVISLIPMPKAEGITSRGLVYPLNNESLEFGIRTGSSNSAKVDGNVEIQYESGRLMLIESSDKPTTL